ncbi:MAG TPA: hypothetical protein PK406_15810, partial [Verrucomicrobiota bacterium]|nr:hypothetical protein [Verrucomicrobiota bacterium]
RAGLAGMKAHTDFNDLATRSELGRAGVERQAQAAVSQARQAQEHRQAQKQKLEPRLPITQNVYRIPGLGGHHQAGKVGGLRRSAGLGGK